jgi:hypothetical protein
MIATGNHGYFDSLRDAPPRRELTELSGENFAVRNPRRFPKLEGDCHASVSTGVQ